MPKTLRLKDFGLYVDESQALQIGADGLDDDNRGMYMGMGRALQPAGLNKPGWTALPQTTGRASFPRLPCET